MFARRVATVRNHPQVSAGAVWPCPLGVLQKRSFLEISNAVSPRLAWQTHADATLSIISIYFKIRRKMVYDMYNLRHFQKMSCIFRGRRIALETFIIIVW